jgi:hypothetical protein
VQPVEVLPERVAQLASDDATGGFDIATQYQKVRLVGPLAEQVLVDAANAWYYLVLGLAVLALVRLPDVRRRSAPLLVVPIAIALYVLLAPYAFSRHLYPAHPALVVLASAALASAWARPAREEDDDRDGSEVACSPA